MILMKRPDLKQLMKRSKNKAVKVPYFCETRLPNSIVTKLELTEVLIATDYDIKMTETKRGFAGWKL